MNKLDPYEELHVDVSIYWDKSAALRIFYRNFKKLYEGQYLFLGVKCNTNFNSLADIRKENIEYEIVDITNRDQSQHNQIVMLTTDDNINAFREDFTVSFYNAPLHCHIYVNGVQYESDYDGQYIISPTSNTRENIIVDILGKVPDYINKDMLQKELDRKIHHEPWRL